MRERRHALVDIPAEAVAGLPVVDRAKGDIRVVRHPRRAKDDDEERGGRRDPQEPFDQPNGAGRHAHEVSKFSAMMRIGSLQQPASGRESETRSLDRREIAICGRRLQPLYRWRLDERRASCSSSPTSCAAS